MSHRDDEPAFYYPENPARCRRCKRKGEDCKCVAPGQIEIDPEDYRERRTADARPRLWAEPNRMRALGRRAP